MIKNNQDYQSILILIMVQKNPIENRINFSLGNPVRFIDTYVKIESNQIY